MSVMDDYEEKRETAISLLMEAGALKTCPVHSEEIVDGPNDVVDAYRLAMARWTRKRHPEFENTKEFTDYIKLVYEEYEDGECGSCASVMAS